jgi:2-polyprenyl-3-methyl-5-hydroxy-6-metoxy-1,4-benzoquinol methylase
LRYVVPRLNFGNVLDFGCGSGYFISKLNEIKTNCAIGYEPFMDKKERCKEDLPIYADYADILKNAPYSTITILEVLEHAPLSEMPNIFAKFKEALSPDGAVIVSVPIEIGPVVLLKELNRLLFHKRKCNYKFFELILTAFFFISLQREEQEHKGFDFRELIKFIKSQSWKVKILCFSPIPIKCWYGNSQVIFTMNR